MSNSECLENLSRRLTLQEEAQLTGLREKIKAIERMNASKGVLKSGGTIKEVMRECVNVLQEKTDNIMKEVGNLPFKPTGALVEEISALSKTFFPEGLGAMRRELERIVQLTGGNDRAMDAALTGVEEASQKAVRDLESRIQQRIISLKSMTSFSWPDKLALSLEGTLLLAIAFLAGKWSNDPQGNYEPYIVILGVVMPVVEIARRVYKRITT